MFLALIVVAALALVSVAAVTAHSSNAEDATWNMGADNNLTIFGTSTTDYNFVLPDGTTSATCDILITSNGNYTGTFSVGTLDRTNPLDPVFTSFASIQMKGASNVRLQASMDSDTGVGSFAISNISVTGDVQKDGTYGLADGAPAGTFELTQGSIELGFDGVPFCGTVTAAGFSMTATYVEGAVLGITADGKGALISGENVAGVVDNDDALLDAVGIDPADYEFPTATLELSGTASVGLPVAVQAAEEKDGTYAGASFSVEKVNVTVMDGATINAGDVSAVLANTVTIVTGDPVDSAFLVDGKGNVIAADSVGATGATFKAVPFGGYTLYAFTDSTAGVMPYVGSVSITAKSVTLNDNLLKSAKDISPLPSEKFWIGGDAANAGLLMFTPTGQPGFTAGTYFFKINNDGSGEVGRLSGAGTVKFATDVEDNSFIFATMTSNDTKLPNYFYGQVTEEVTTGVGTADLNEIATVTVGTEDFVQLLALPAVAGTVGPGEIFGGTVTLSSSNIGFLVTDVSTLLVEGTMNFTYTDADNNGILDIRSDGLLSFNGTGIVYHQISGLANDAYHAGDVPGVFGSNNPDCGFAYYITSTTTQSTYNFTSLNNAIKNSNTVYLEGKNVILENTNLVSPNDDPLTVILAPGATLEVGDGTAAPTLTIPDGTTLDVTDGSYEVVSGMAVYDVKPEAGQEPAADILIDRGTKFIYTDVATALNTVSQSGDVLELLRSTDLKVNAELKSGVELKDTNGELTIPAVDEKNGVGVLTVNGTLTVGQGMTIEGLLLINNTANFNKTAVVAIDDGGQIHVASAGKLNITDARVSGADTSTLTVDGTVNLTGSVVNVTVLTIGAGTLTVDKDSAFTVDKTMLVGVQPTVSTKNVNNATISGVVTLGPAAVATVYGAKDMSAVFVDAPNVVYNIDGAVYVTMYYGTAGGQIKMLYEDQLKDITILNWNNDRFFRGAYLIDPTDGTLNDQATVGDASWAIVYAQFEPKMYTVTFAYLQGMTWIGNSLVPQNGTMQIQYGATVVVTTAIQPGFAGTPALTVQGPDDTSAKPYSAGTQYTVVGDTTFAATGVDVAGAPSTSSGGLTLIEYLLIIIVIIIAIIAIIIAIRLLRS